LPTLAVKGVMVIPGLEAGFKRASVIGGSDLNTTGK
jgi:hypothetical protein